MASTTEFEFPLGSTRFRVILPNAHALRRAATPLADLPATQAAVGRYMSETLVKIRARLSETLPAREGKKSTPLAYQRVVLFLPDDSRRVGFDPWLAELADGITQAGSGEIPVQGFVLGQLDDPPLGLRLIRHLGEDFCGRFAAESHRAGHEEDHDPEQEGLDNTALQRKTLYVAIRPVFESAHWTNDQAVFLARGLLAEPLAGILEHAALDAALALPAAAQPLADPVALALTSQPAAYAAALGPLMAHVVDAPFKVDHRGEPVLKHVADSAVADKNAGLERFDTVISATGLAPTDLWFSNLLAAALHACTRVNPGGRLIIVGACDEGLPFPELRDALIELQGCACVQAMPAMRARASTVENIALRMDLLRLGAILAHAGNLIFVSPGLLPEEDDDDSERIRREIPPGPRVTAAPTVEAALAIAPVATGTLGVVEA